MNTFGNIFRLTSFGESHGKIIGGAIDGCPAGLRIDGDFVSELMSRRSSGQSNLTTPRKEPDSVEFVSGLKRGYTTGAPLAFLIPNIDVRSGDYEDIAEVFRPGHADYTYHSKYGGYQEILGGGRASARETAVRCVGGAVASILLHEIGVDLAAFISRIGSISISNQDREKLLCMDIAQLKILTTASATYCPLPELDLAMGKVLLSAKADGDSLGGVVECIAKGVPVGWGEPIYSKLESMLAAGMMSINAARGFEIGDGFSLASMRGSQANDAYGIGSHGRVSFLSNHCGGVLGGISSGSPIFCRVAFKPTPTIALRQSTVSRNGQVRVLQAKGRHDPCVAIRAVAVVEAMAALVLADAYLMSRASALLG
ncbi:chorismate synthase [Porphyromonas crevioricanis JCM 15906]|uniref:Chorismate synthase n=1 Tax=Porphyromonas crevioricanis JCM 15906 TaxID=1305617 RepID=T1CSP6_9PORP|nr:chorismate synthase [Porphyromonas crevioricanis]GAD06193.1 chorismate synthase [Porphyromonas crevioricanis JCM 15906]SJZ73292.1 chorismate synthase [Porphyromonas crevioricanis]